MTFLFQGDSVTDCGRDRKQPADLGNGYVSLIARGLREPGARILNRGVSGDRLRQLEARWERDCLAIRPDVVTILIGINDIWRHFDSGLDHDLEVFEFTYQRLLDSLAADSPRVILMEPFLLPSTPETEHMRPLLDATIQVVRTVARRNRAELVPLDGIFAAASAHQPARHLSEDGVHPSAAGHRLIASAWLAAFHASPPAIPTTT